VVCPTPIWEEESSNRDLYHIKSPRKDALQIQLPGLSYLHPEWIQWSGSLKKLPFETSFLRHHNHPCSLMMTSYDRDTVPNPREEEELLSYMLGATSYKIGISDISMDLLLSPCKLPRCRTHVRKLIRFQITQVRSQRMQMAPGTSYLVSYSTAWQAGRQLMPTLFNRIDRLRLYAPRRQYT
jgi:hypothetical protein